MTPGSRTGRVKAFAATFFVLHLPLFTLAQSFKPIEVRGFNHDVVAESPTASPLATTTTEIDAFTPSNFVLLSKTYARSRSMPVGYGLPDNGRIVQQDKVYQLNKFSGPNALYLRKGSEGTLAFAPLKLDAIAILGLATESDATLEIILSFMDGTTVRSFEGFSDWFDGLSPVIRGVGRVKREDGANPYYEGAPENPRLYSIVIQLPQGKVLNAVTFRNISSGSNPESNRAVIFGLSGYKKPEPVVVVEKKQETLPEQPKPAVVETRKTSDPQPKEQTVIHKPVPEQVALMIRGSVTDKKTGQALGDASIRFNHNGTDLELRTIRGNYLLTPVEKSIYSITVSSQGYIDLKTKIDLANWPANGEVSFSLDPIEVGTHAVLNGVLFKQSTAILLDQSYPQLDSIADFLRKNPSIQIEVAGHTDSYGSKKANLKLSNERAAEIKKYLVTNGVAVGRISSKGYGGSMPIAPNNTEESRRLNRRVEFVIVGK